MSLSLSHEGTRDTSDGINSIVPTSHDLLEHMCIQLDQKLSIPILSSPLAATDN